MKNTEPNSDSNLTNLLEKFRSTILTRTKTILKLWTLTYRTSFGKNAITWSTKLQMQ